MPRRISLLRRAGLLTLAACALAGPATAQARTLDLGFSDPTFAAPDGPAWLSRAAGAGAAIVRVNVTWAQLAPGRPAVPTDPADPAYRWAPLDEQVAAATAAGLRVLVRISAAPAWAEAPGRPRSAGPGAWKPAAAAFGAFARALAARYAGHTPGVPAVRLFQAWNEPNLPLYLAPQWTKVRGHWTASSPARYRTLLDAFATGIAAVQPRATVVTAGTAPFGDPAPGGARMMPARFLRALLCLDSALHRTACPRKAQFDVLAHHPYSVRGPDATAYNADDVSVADMGKVRRILRAAERERTVLPAGRKRLWVTELSWDSSPDPDGISASRQARWLDGALYRLWDAGVDTVLWFLIRDQLPDPSYAATYQSGLYRHDGTAKPSLTALRLPFVADPRGGGRLRLWLRAPAPGPVVVERRTAAGWTAVTRLTATAAGQVLTRDVRSAATVLRARSTTQTSLPWATR